MARGLVFFGTRIAPLGWLGATLSVATVFTTAMIYTQMRAVPRWYHASTPALFLSFSLSGGALLAGEVAFAVPLLGLAGAVQLYTWIDGDRRFARSGTDIATATGLGDRGRVRAFESPHTGGSYLLREFVHVVGRKHSRTLRGIALLFGFVVPILLLMLPFNHALAAFAVLSHVAGLLASRWLFFAEAEHVVGLYYGKRQSPA